MLTVVLATPTLAAMNATLSITQGYAGLKAKLMTDDYGNSTAYNFIANQPPQPVYLIAVEEEVRDLNQFGAFVCGTGAQARIGQLKWADDTGTLSFVVPKLPKGEYHFLIYVGPGVSDPPCWRLDGPKGPLTLTIADRPAEGSTTVAAPVATARGKGGGLVGPYSLAIVFGIVALMFVATIYRLRRRKLRVTAR
jgi:hypothetical protein